MGQTRQLDSADSDDGAYRAGLVRVGLAFSESANVDMGTATDRLRLWSQDESTDNREERLGSLVGHEPCLR